MKAMRLAFAGALALGLAAWAPRRVEAQSFAPPLPADVYIQFGGLDWAWAAPCSMGVPGSCLSQYVLVDGFRFATPEEWAARPDWSNFLNQAGGVICASGYFDVSPQYQHCDLSDAQQGYISSGPDLYVRFDPNMETWLVRGAAVPEPGTIGLVGVGLALVGMGARRRRQA